MNEVRETYKEFKERVIHTKDDLFAILFLNFITIRIAYLIKRWNLKISPNQITFTRLFVLSPLIILCLLLAPLLEIKVFYLVAILLSYLFLLSDWLDGQLARGLNKTSKKGAFLDSVADRFSTIIFFTLLFSIGLWFNNLFLICGSIVLFVLKTFHMMVITKIFYYGLDKGKENAKVFSGNVAFNTIGIGIIFKAFKKINSVLKIKRWGEGIGGSERYFITIIIPLILVVCGLKLIPVYFLYFLIIFFILFFLIRIKNLFKDEVFLK